MQKKIKEFIRLRFAEMRRASDSYARNLEELEGQLYLLVEMSALEMYTPKQCREAYIAWKDKTYPRCPASWPYLKYLREASPKDVLWDNIFRNSQNSFEREAFKYEWYARALVDHYLLFLDHINVIMIID